MSGAIRLIKSNVSLIFCERFSYIVGNDWDDFKSRKCQHYYSRLVDINKIETLYNTRQQYNTLHYITSYHIALN